MSNLSLPFMVGLTLLVPAALSFAIGKIVSDQAMADKWAVVLSFFAGILIVLVRIGLLKL